MLSEPGVYPFFDISSAQLISAFQCGFVLTSNNISVIGMSGHSNGDSLLIS